MMESEACGAAPAVPTGAVPPGPENQTQVRERILRQFEAWLDEVLRQERPVEGIAAQVWEQLQRDPGDEGPRSGTPAEPAPEAAAAGCDLYSLWSVVTALVEETRLQGRAFKQLHDSLGPMRESVGSVDAALERYAATLDQQDQRIHESTRQAVLKEVLGTFIDVRDRLVRGADTAGACLERTQVARVSRVRRWWRKVFPAPARIQAQQGEAVRSLLQGYRLGLEIVEEALQRFGVHPVDCLGRPFDPGTMKAVDLDTTSEAEDGTVLEVYRPGYWWNETVYRPAEVKVARRTLGT
jgi:molecular chaperone GrpE